jgi:diamine N-acetyltransferase
MNITLKNVTRDNFDEVIKLEVHESQNGFVASNMYSIAESKVYDNFCPRAIYAKEQKEQKDELVGFLMYGQDDGKTDDVWIIRLMVSKAYQGKGYGKCATIKVIEEIRKQYNPEAIFLSFEPENDIAKKLYVSLGFEDTGRVEYGELVYRLDLKNYTNQSN